MSLIRASLLPRSSLVDMNDPMAWSILGGMGRKTTAGENVSPITAMGLSTYFACVRAISEDVGKLPFLLYRLVAGGGKERATDNPLYRLLRVRPNPETSAGVFRETITGWSLGWGNGYAEIQRDGRGKPVALWPIHPSRMRIVRVDGIIYYDVTSPEWQPGAVVRFEQRDILHIRGFGDNQLAGLSVAQLAAESIGISLAAQTFGAAFFGNGATLGLVLEHPGRMKEDAVDRLRKSWAKMHGGPGNAHKVAVLEDGMKANKIGVPPDDAQFIQTREFQRDEVASWFRMPPHKVGSMKQATFSNIEQQSLEYVSDTLMPWLRRWEEECEFKLLDDRDQESHELLHMVAALLRGDATARSNFYRSMISTGAMSPDEAREMENLNPIPGGAGKKFYMQGAMATLDRIVAGPPAAPAGGAPKPGDPAEPASDPPADDAPDTAKQAAALRPVFDAAEARCRQKERMALAVAAKKHAPGSPAMREWAVRFYAELSANLHDAFIPCCDSLLALMGTAWDVTDLQQAIADYACRARDHATATGQQFTPDEPLAQTILNLLTLEHSHA